MRRTHARRPIPAAGFALFLLPVALQAQVPALTRGQPVNGTIAEGDLKLAEGHLYDVYTFDAQPGEIVTITLRSPEFDTYAVLARSSGVITEELATDDDGAGGTDARLVHTVETGGPYLVIVRGYDAAARGAYAVELATIEHVAPTVSPIRVGEVRVSELASDDDFTDDMAWYEYFTFQGRAGERVGATMRSSQFDSYVVIGRWDGTTFEPLGMNDDGFDDGTTDARLRFTLPVDGQYAVRATSLTGQQSGQFTIGLEALPPAAEPSRTPIRAGETLTGELSDTDAELDDGSFYDYFVYTGRAGEQVTVTLRSAAFDAYLAVGDQAGEGGFGELASDDDGAGGTDSQVTVAVPASGVLLIRANSLSGGTTGGYSVSVQAGGM